MAFPEIKVDTKVVIGLAILSLVVSYIVYAENKRLKNEINSATSGRKSPCGCREKTIDVVIPTAEQVVEGVTEFFSSSTPSSAASPTKHLEDKGTLGPHDTVII